MKAEDIYIDTRFKERAYQSGSMDHTSGLIRALLVKALKNHAACQNRAFVSSRTERKVRIALRAIHKVHWIEPPINNWKTQQNLLFINVFIWRIKFPCKSMAFSNFSYNTLFNATSVKLRLRALSMQKGMCGF